MPVLLSWSAKVQILKEFYAANGHCKVPQKYRDPKSGFSLGKWVSNVRRTRSELHPWQIKQLYQDGMEFCWNVHTNTWDTWFQLLLDYQKEKNHVNPSSDEEFRGKKIGGWVVQQQKLYARTLMETKSDNNTSPTKTCSKKKAGSLGTTLSQDRIDRLNAIGFDWKAPSAFHRGKLDIKPMVKVPVPVHINEVSVSQSNADSSSSGSSVSSLEEDAQKEQQDEASLSSASSASAASDDSADFLFFVQNNHVRNRKPKGRRPSKCLPLRKRKGSLQRDAAAQKEQQQQEEEQEILVEQPAAKRIKLPRSVTVLPDHEGGLSVLKSPANRLALLKNPGNMMAPPNALDNLLMTPQGHHHHQRLVRAQQERHQQMLRLNDLILQQKIAETRMQQQRLLALQDMMLMPGMAPTTTVATASTTAAAPAVVSMPVGAPLPAVAVPGALPATTTTTDSVRRVSEDEQQEVICFAGQNQMMTVRSFC